MSSFKFGDNTKINGHVGDEVHYGDNKSSTTINETIENGDIVVTESPPRVIKKGEKILIIIGILTLIVTIIIGLMKSG